ncbi:hypothetical protein POVWA1_059770 [Plasmodium ovale wallikeri]|uniref:Uncharacterized protein n=1 Tax=Plasmodium ovale wallikeri TaxID=864142 RepID=A0A1A9A0D8_PLAOA|nr:hypothetical protein POVWA1_059770 [Plasmodium ovale wallikeri]
MINYWKNGHNKRVKRMQYARRNRDTQSEGELCQWEKQHGCKAFEREWGSEREMNDGDWESVKCIKWSGKRCSANERVRKAAQSLDNPHCRFALTGNDHFDIMQGYNLPEDVTHLPRRKLLRNGSA